MSNLTTSPETLAYYEETFALAAEQVVPEVLFDEALRPGGLSIQAMRSNDDHIGYEILAPLVSYAALPHLTGETTPDHLVEHRIRTAASPIGRLLLPRATVKSGTIQEMTIERVSPADMPNTFIKLGKNDAEIPGERSHVIVRAKSTVGSLALGITTTPIETTKHYRAGGSETSQYVAAFAGTLPTSAMTEFDLRRRQARDRQAIAMKNAYGGGRVSPR